MFMKDIMPHCEEFDHEDFLLKKLWNPYCDYVYKANISVMRHLFDKYCDHTKKFKCRKNFDLYDFYQFIRDAGLINTCISEREPILIFNLSIMTQVDEINYNRHLRMNFTEFLNAFARLANRLDSTIEKPMPTLFEKVAELIRISAGKCLQYKNYEVKMPPYSLRDLKIDLNS